VAAYILKRLTRSLITLFLVVSAVFMLLRLMPLEGYFNNYEKLTPTQIKVGLAKLWLDRPMAVQLGHFWQDTLRGELGVSNKYRVNYPIGKIIASKAPLSIQIGLMAVTLAFLLGMPLGILMARSARGHSRLKIWDRFGTVVVVVIQAVPASVYYLFIQIYGTELLGKFFPLPTLFARDNPLTWILPVFSLSLSTMAWSAMWIRRYMADESTKDYVLLARAKGVPAAAISRRHIFRNAFVPLVQSVPTTILLTLMGSLYVESRFSIPGMGGLLVDVIKRQDNTMVQALVLVYSGISIVGLLLGDVAMALLDPRVRFAGKGDAR
jgi:oligopeptide transport system permease protein